MRFNVILVCGLIAAEVFANLFTSIYVTSKLERFQKKLENVNEKLLVNLATYQMRNGTDASATLTDRCRQHDLRSKQEPDDFDTLVWKLTQCKARLAEIEFEKENLDKCVERHSNIAKELIECKMSKETMQRFKESTRANKCIEMLAKTSDANGDCETANSVTVSRLKKEIVRVENEKSEAQRNFTKCVQDISRNLEYSTSLQLNMTDCKNVTPEPTPERNVETLKYRNC